jgi:hypothetical protein
MVYTFSDSGQYRNWNRQTQPERADHAKAGIIIDHDLPCNWRNRVIKLMVIDKNIVFQTLPAYMQPLILHTGRKGPSAVSYACHWREGRICGPVQSKGKPWHCMVMCADHRRIGAGNDPMSMAFTLTARIPGLLMNVGKTSGNAGFRKYESRSPVHPAGSRLEHIGPRRQCGVIRPCGSLPWMR